MRWVWFVAALLSVIAPGGAAQDATLAGTWSVTAAEATGQTEDGGNWRRDAISGTLELEQTKGALKGRWQGPQGAPWPLTGKLDGGRFDLKSESREVRVVRNGEETIQSMHWTFRGTAEGDKMTGTMVLTRDDSGSGLAHAFTAVRKR